MSGNIGHRLLTVELAGYIRIWGAGRNTCTRIFRQGAFAGLIGNDGSLVAATGFVEVAVTHFRGKVCFGYRRRRPGWSHANKAGSHDRHEPFEISEATCHSMFLPAWSPF